MTIIRSVLDLFNSNFLVSNVLFLLALAGTALLFTRAARIGRGVVFGSLVLLAIFGFSPLSHVMRWTLENRFPPLDAVPGRVDGIIVLAGAPERTAKAIELARSHPEARLVFSGGVRTRSGRTEAEDAALIFEEAGIPRERVMLEGRARNTAESAKFTKDLVRPQPEQNWVVVTTALHMPRAVGAFRGAGFPVLAFPVNRRIVPEWLTEGSPGIVQGLRSFDVGMYEWMGLAFYRLSGRSSEFFPAPKNL
jgi:uncharacterized SAM-binding protein YcdF (DUF218 family)